MRSTSKRPKRAKTPRARRPARPRKSSEAQRRAEAVELALAGFAHEVRTPLTGILAIADLLDASGLDARTARWVKTLKLSAEHLAALTTLVVDSARARKLGRAAASLLRDEEFDLGALAQAAADSLAVRAEAKGLVTKVSIAKSAGGRVRGDPVRLRAALENLIDNAVKFTERGTVAMKVSAKQASAGRRRISFAIVDDGVGLSAREISGLFRPFAQGEGGIAQRFGGAGLGLYAVRNLARLMGGDVTVESTPAKGSTFTLAVVPARVAARAAPAQRRRRAAMRPLDLLCVEDNPYGRVVLNTILTELGHRVAFAETGEAALEALRRQRYDAVLLDLVLPGMSGIVTARRIRALPDAAGATPIVGLSGKDADMRRALSAGMDAFLVKPASARALADALRVVTAS